MYTLDNPVSVSLAELALVSAVGVDTGGGVAAGVVVCVGVGIGAVGVG